MTKTWIKRLFTLALALCAGLAYAAEVVSLNFYSDQGAVGTDAQAGLESAGGWNNLTGASGAAFLNIWDGTTTSESTVFLSYSSNNGYQYITENTEMYLRGYLDDGGNQVSIEVSDIPFSQYDVIVYTATDTDARAFKPVKINDTWYAGSAGATAIGYAATVTEGNKDATTWGASRSDSAAYGTNALRVNGLSGDLTINGGTNSNNARGGIAAVQIINTGTVIATPEAEIAREVKASEIVWTVEPASDKSAKLTAAEAATVNLDEAFAVSSLITVGEAIKFIGEFDLTLGSLSVSADTDISELTGTISLGTVSIAPGKTLTVKDESVLAPSAVLAPGGTGMIRYKNLEIGGQIASAATIYVGAGDVAQLASRQDYRFILDGGNVYTTSTEEFWLGANAKAVQIKSGVMDLTSVTANNGSSAFLLSWKGNNVPWTISGGILDATNTSISAWQGGTTLAISGGFVRSKGFRDGGFSSIAITGGTVEIGATGIESSRLGSLTSAFAVSGGGTVRAIENATISTPIWSDSTSGCFQAVDGTTLTISGTFKGEGAVYTIGAEGGSAATQTRTGLCAYEQTDVGVAGTVKLAGLFEQTPEFAVKSGTLDVTALETLPEISVASGATLLANAGTEGAMVVPEGATLKLVLSDVQFTTGYNASEVNGSVTFVRVDDEGNLTVVEDGVDGNAYTYPVPTWTPVNANSSWTDTGLWTNDYKPTSGDIVINATGLESDISVEVPSSFESVTVAGNETFVTEVSFATAPSELTVFGKVKLPIDTINNVTTLTVSDGAVLIADVASASEATLTRELSGDYAFWKDGEGTLTLGANINVNNGVEIRKGIVKFGNGLIPYNGNAGYPSSSAGNVRVHTEAVLDINGVPDSYLVLVTLDEGAVLRNSGNVVGQGKRQLKAIALNGNATVDTDSEFGLVANGHTETTLTLNGHTLTKTGTGSFLLVGTTGSSSGAFRIKKGSLTLAEQPSNLAGVNLSIEGNASLVLNARLASAASLKFRAGNSGVNFTGVSNLDAGIRPTLDAAFVDPETLAVGNEVTLITDSAAGLTNGLFSTIAVGGRFSTTTETEGVVTATVGALTNFWHYSFDGAGVTEALSRAADSRYYIRQWGDVNGSGKNVNSRNGRAACLYHENDSNRFVAYWGNNSTGLSPFYAGVATIISVVKPKDTDKKVIWGLGDGLNANINCVALVVDDETTMSLVTNDGAALVTVSGIKNLTENYHYVAAVFTLDGTTLMVDDITVTTDKVVPSTIDGKGQLGSVYNNAPLGYYRQGSSGCYLDDWAVYDAILTKGELKALRTKFCPKPFYIRIR